MCAGADAAYPAIVLAGLTIGWACVLFVATPVAVRRVSLPTRILTVGYLAIGSAGTLIINPPASVLGRYNYNEFTYFQSLSWWDRLTPFVVIAAAIFTGGLIVHLMMPGRVAELTARAPVREGVHLTARWLWLSVLTVAAFILGTGPSYIMRSPVYRPAFGSHTLKLLGTALLPAAMLVAALVAFSPEVSRGGKRRAVAVLGVTELLEFGAGSRGFALFPVLVFVGGWLTQRWNLRQSIIRGGIAVALSIGLLGVPLGLRTMPEHGILPALGYLFTQPGTFFSGESNPLYNLLLGVPLSLYVGSQVNPIPASAFWVSVTPLPGAWTDWAQVQQSLRLNAFEPYPALGELLNHGWVAVVGYSVVVGIVFEVLAAVAWRSGQRFGAPMRAIMMAGAGVVLVRSSQYNLRTESRLIYYMIVGVLSLAAFPRLTRRAARAARSDRLERLRQLR
jgi:hypothetical protein